MAILFDIQRLQAQQFVSGDEGNLFCRVNVSMPEKTSNFRLSLIFLRISYFRTSSCSESILSLSELSKFASGHTFETVEGSMSLSDSLQTSKTLLQEVLSRLLASMSTEKAIY